MVVFHKAPHPLITLIYALHFSHAKRELFELFSEYALNTFPFVLSIVSLCFCVLRSPIQSGDDDDDLKWEPRRLMFSMSVCVHFVRRRGWDWTERPVWQHDLFLDPVRRTTLFVRYANMRYVCVCVLFKCAVVCVHSVQLSHATLSHSNVCVCVGPLGVGAVCTLCRIHKMWALPESYSILLHFMLA